MMALTKARACGTSHRVQWTHGTHRSYRSYRRSSVASLVAVLGLLCLLSGCDWGGSAPAKVDKKVEGLTGGHTPGHQVVVLDDRGLFWGDLFPTSHHLSPPRTMAYDLFPAELVERKLALLAESAEKDWLNFLYHDLDPRPGRILRDGSRYRFDRAE